eukprot:scaffold199555_cov26-Tisochrysis_lutea.AAC.2
MKWATPTLHTMRSHSPKRTLGLSTLCTHDNMHTTRLPLRRSSLYLVGVCVSWLNVGDASSSNENAFYPPQSGLKSRIRRSKSRHLSSPSFGRI